MNKRVDKCQIVPPVQGASELTIRELTGLCEPLSILKYFLPKSTSFPPKTTRHLTTLKGFFEVASWDLKYSRLSLNGHLYKTDTSLKRTPRVGPCLSLTPLFDSL